MKKEGLMVSKWIIREVSFATYKKEQEVDAQALTKSLTLLEKGVAKWNKYRVDNPDFKPYLKNVNLSATNKKIPGSLEGIDFSEANLEDTDLSDIYIANSTFWNANLQKTTFVGTNAEKSCFDRANLRHSNFTEAFMSFATFNHADLTGSVLIDSELIACDFANANLSYANLSNADASRIQGNNVNLRKSTLEETDFSDAELQNSDLTFSLCIRTNFSNAYLTGAKVFGISAWDVNLKNTHQESLNIFEVKKPKILVDDIEVAQFVYLLLKHNKLNKVINAVTQNGVLLLGEFKNGGYKFLNTIAKKLRKKKYIPIIFDFDRPTYRNYTETITTLVGLVKFVIADLNGPSVPQELSSTIPNFKIPFIFISQDQKKPYSMYKDLLEYDWVIKPLVKYIDAKDLVSNSLDEVIKKAEEKVRERAERMKNY